MSVRCTFGTLPHPNTGCCPETESGHLLTPLLLLDHLGTHIGQTDGQLRGCECPAGRWGECSRQQSPVWSLVQFNRNACGPIISACLRTVLGAVSNPQRWQWMEVTVSRQHTILTYSHILSLLCQNVQSSGANTAEERTHEWGQVRGPPSPKGHFYVQTILGTEPRTTAS